MKQVLSYFFLFLLSTTLALASDEADKAVLQGNFKKAIELYKVLIPKKQGEDKELLQLKLAKAFLKDQDQEKGFKTFLELLGKIKTKTAPSMSKEEKVHYEKALATYLDHRGGKPLEIAKKIVTEFSPISNKQPNAHHLAYILAAAHANLGQFEKFFDLFYRSYRFYPDHFLAYKVKAVLHVKLFEKCHDTSDREFHRKEILTSLSKALERQPKDTSLYKFLILFSSEEQKAEILRTCLNKIIDKNIILPRSDIAFYVEEAVKAKDLILARRFVDKARSWYQYSRVINAAQQYIDKHLND